MRAGQKCPSLETIKLGIKQERESKSLPRAPRKPSAAGSRLVSLFTANIPRTEFAETARLLGMISNSDLPTIASRIRFKTLRSEQLSRPDAQMETDCSFDDSERG